jgi:hypothetical protein
MCLARFGLIISVAYFAAKAANIENIKERLLFLSTIEKENSRSGI